MDYSFYCAFSRFLKKFTMSCFTLHALIVLLLTNTCASPVILVFSLEIAKFFFAFLKIILLRFRFWGTCEEHARLLHRYIHGNVVCCLPPCHLYLAFLPMLSLPNFPPPAVPPLVPPQQTSLCDAPLSLSMCSHC